MIERKTGKIINISSIGGRHGARGRGPYRASKAGLINFTETLAAETREHGIDVNCICPGGVDTEMMRQIALGAVGVCCQKVSEAEVLADGGVDDILEEGEPAAERYLEFLFEVMRGHRFEAGQGENLPSVFTVDSLDYLLSLTVHRSLESQ
jgi:NAD(P)-dependent dehydrogenase (short-subunit alcohol dehydrogenase family)